MHAHTGRFWNYPRKTFLFATKTLECFFFLFLKKKTLECSRSRVDKNLLSLVNNIKSVIRKYDILSLWLSQLFTDPKDYFYVSLIIYQTSKICFFYSTNYSKKKIYTLKFTLSFVRIIFFCHQHKQIAKILNNIYFLLFQISCLKYKWH